MALINKYKKHKDLTGNKYGRITLLEFVGMRGTRAIYTASCDCGKLLGPRLVGPIIYRHLHGLEIRGCGSIPKLRHGAKRKFAESTKRNAFCHFVVAVKKQIEKGRECDAWTIDSWYKMCSEPCIKCRKTDIKNIAKIGGCRDGYTEEDINKYDLLLNGLDRADSKKGYTKENCRPCCWGCNKAKSNQTESEFYEMIIRIVKHRGLNAGH